MARQAAFGLESTWNTGVTPTKVLEAVSESLHVEKTSININTIRSPQTRSTENDQERAVGDINAVVNFEEVQLLAFMFNGNVTTTGVGPYTHKYPGTSGVLEARRAITIEIERDFTAFTYPGMLCTALGIDIQRGQELRARTSWQGPSDNVSTAAATSLTYAALNVAVPRQVSIKIDGGAAIDAQSFTLDTVWPVDDPYVLGNTTYGVIPKSNDVLGVSFSFDYLLTAVATVDTAYLANTEVDIQADVQTSGTDALTINLNKCKFTEHQMPLDGRQRLVATARGSAYFDTTATGNFETIVINDTVNGDFT